MVFRAGRVAPVFMCMIPDIEVLTRGPACPESHILAAEQALGLRLPAQLRRAYLDVDGFLGPTRARFLYPLACRTAFSPVTLQTLTLILRSLPESAPLWRDAVAFGDYGIGSTWGMTAAGRIFEWWPQDGAEAFYLDVDLQVLWLERGRLFGTVPAF